MIKFNRSWNAKWASVDYYVCCCEYIGTKDGRSKYKIHYLHRWIKNAKDNEYVDHKDHDTFNNLEDNLRITTNSKNNQNRKSANKNSSTGVRNVNLITRYGGEQEYWVQFCKNGERFKWEFTIDQFQEACTFADIKRVELFGEFAGNS